MPSIRYFDPRLLRPALIVVSIAVSLATGAGISLAGDDTGGP